MKILSPIVSSFRDCTYRDHLGNNRMDVGKNGSVWQICHYYPFGMLMGDSYIPERQRWKFGGKELDRVSGLDLSDFEARPYDPALGRFLRPDPLADKYHPLSPFLYCAANPLRLIDPDGMDIWKVNSMGEIVSHEVCKDYDRVYVVDDDGNEIVDEIGSPQYVEFDYGTIKQRNIKIDGENSYDIYEVRGDEVATELYEFFANNITAGENQVEFGLTRTGVAGEKGLNFITTSHQAKEESGLVRLFYGQIQFGYHIREFNHSHPIGPGPSPQDIKTLNGILKEYMYNNNILLNIYHVPSKAYKKFHANYPP